MTMPRDAATAALNRLVQACKDGESGLRHGADHARSAPLRALLERRADACLQAATELQALVSAGGGAAHDRGSASAAMQRGWQAVKASVAGTTDAALLAEAERGERETLAHYAEALLAPLSSAARGVVERQQQDVQHRHALLQIQIEQEKK